MSLASDRTGPQPLVLDRLNQAGCYTLARGESGFCAGLKTGEWKEMIKHSLLEMLHLGNRV